jgi:hypothetical protein
MTRLRNVVLVVAGIALALASAPPSHAAVDCDSLVGCLLPDPEDPSTDTPALQFTVREDGPVLIRADKYAGFDCTDPNGVSAGEEDGEFEAGTRIASTLYPDTLPQGEQVSVRWVVRSDPDECAIPCINYTIGADPPRCEAQTGN